MYMHPLPLRMKPKPTSCCFWPGITRRVPKHSGAVATFCLWHLSWLQGAVSWCHSLRCQKTIVRRLILKKKLTLMSLILTHTHIFNLCKLDVLLCSLSSPPVTWRCIIKYFWYGLSLHDITKHAHTQGSVGRWTYCIEEWRYNSG